MSWHAVLPWWPMTAAGRATSPSWPGNPGCARAGGGPGESRGIYIGAGCPEVLRPGPHRPLHKNWASMRLAMGRWTGRKRSRRYLRRPSRRHGCPWRWSGAGCSCRRSSRRGPRADRGNAGCGRTARVGSAGAPRCRRGDHRKGEGEHDQGDQFLADLRPIEAQLASRKIGRPPLGIRSR